VLCESCTDKLSDPVWNASGYLPSSTMVMSILAVSFLALCGIVPICW
jgi:hypothetical protein